jgi:hypothetical protein
MRRCLRRATVLPKQISPKVIRSCEAKKVPAHRAQADAAYASTPSRGR